MEEAPMRRTMALTLVLALSGCGDFVDEDGNTSIRQVAEGLQSVGERVAELGEALERDAGVEAVAWEDLATALPRRVDGAERIDEEGDAATDRNGAGMSLVHRKYLVDGDTVFVGVADLGAFRGGVELALHWVAPLFSDGDLKGEVEQIELEGYPGIRVRDETDDGLLVAVMVERRFAVVAGAEGYGHDALLREVLRDVDFGRLEGWEDFGTH
jgi:hypothetical protein